MGTFQPKPYRKLCKVTGKWIWVIPEPVSFKKEIKRGGKMIHVVKFLTL